MAINHPTQHKRSSTAGNKPAAGILRPGEIAVNFADKSIYTEDAGGNVIELERDIFISATAPLAYEGAVWYDTSINELKVYDGAKWVNIAFSGKDVLPANTSSAAGFASGSGTSGSPYIVNVVTVNSGTLRRIVDTITVTGLNPGQLVSIVDQGGTGRFSFSNLIADSTGTLIFQILFDDSPSSAPGTTYSCSIQIGLATTYINESVIIAAAAVTFPQAVTAPTDTTSKATTWTSPNDTLTSSGCLLISTDNVTFTQGPLTVNTGNTLYTKWSGAPGSGLCIDQAHGTNLSETLTASDGSTQTLSMVIDKSPNAFTWVDDTGVATSSVTDSNTITLAGFNSYGYIFGSTTGTQLEYSKNGGAWTAVPASATATDYFIAGDNVQVRHTNGATASTTYDATVNIGLGSDIYSSTTAAVTPSVATPSITAPVHTATNISTTVSITSDTYSPLNGAGTHASTDWEIYSDAGLTTLFASSLNDTTNLTSWSPAGLAAGTQYWVRVKYRSNDPIESSWSSVVEFTTGAVFSGWQFTMGQDLATAGGSIGLHLGSVANDPSGGNILGAGAGLTTATVALSQIGALPAGTPATWTPGSALIGAGTVSGIGLAMFWDKIPPASFVRVSDPTLPLTSLTLTGTLTNNFDSATSTVTITSLSSYFPDVTGERHSGFSPTSAGSGHSFVADGRIYTLEVTSVSFT